MSDGKTGWGRCGVRRTYIIYAAAARAVAACGGVYLPACRMWPKVYSASAGHA
ncbi:MAG: hypothetical protein LBP64_10170 [Tannerella sp.]|nr:hypothetical protein [Tannerella sp.]